MGTVDISVIMSVYNTDVAYLKEAIESILNQTYRCFEFIIVDDGCDEKVKGIIAGYDDERIKVIVNEKNMGLTKSLNIALRAARGKYIARMDADDISYPDRLKKQYEFLETHEKVGVLGCWTCNNLNKKIEHWHGAVPSEWRKIEMLFVNCGVAHPSAMLRKSILDENAIEYDEEIKKAQDYDLWTRLLRYTEMRVYPEVLLMYRIHDKQITVENKGQQRYYNERIRRRLFCELFGQFTEQDIYTCLNLSDVSNSLVDIEKVFDIVERENARVQIYDRKILHYELTRLWIEWILPQRLKQKEHGVFLNPYAYRGMMPGYIIWRMKMYIWMHYV